MIGFFQETGPCEVVQMEDGTYGTQPRLWGWDRSSNMLFIDQPAQVGFSYADLVNGTMNLLNGSYNSPPTAQTGPYLLNGTFSNLDSSATANTTEIAAHAMWHFLQGFLAAFPQYNPGAQPNSSTTAPTGINLFTESYGGMYGPTFAAFFQEQNENRANGTLSANSTLEIRLETLGIINGLIDELIQVPYYPRFAWNNTYNIEVIDAVTELNALSNYTNPGGCEDLIAQCRSAVDGLDPQGEGDVQNVNSICSNATGMDLYIHLQ